MKRKSIALVFIIFFSIIIVSCNNKNLSKEKEDDFQNNDIEYIHSFDSDTNLEETIGDIRYSVPNSWSPEIANNGNYYYPENGMLYVSISYDTFDVTDSNFKEEYINGFSSNIENYVEKDSYNSEINGIDFFVCEFSGIMSDFEVNGKNYSFCSNGIFYNFFYCDTNAKTNKKSHIKDFDEIIKSISFIKDEIPSEQKPSMEIEESSGTAKPDEIDISIEYRNALESAESYSALMHMSKQGIYDQLTSEYGDQFSAEAAQYAIDNIDADWNDNALQSAKSYSDNMHMSKQGIYDQLISEHGEKFTEEEAQYAVDNLEADYKNNALQTAISYQENMSMSPEAIRDQLTSDYGEKFTQEEADYAIENLPK